MEDQTFTPPIPEARLLVVDDEPQVRSVLARSLSMWGYRVDEAISGQQALVMLENAPYDLMILDLRMPGMDGMEVMRRAQQVCPGLPIIILTGHATLESAIAAVKSHAANYLLKPVSLQEITTAVADALQKRADKLRRDHLIKVIDQTVGALHGIESLDELSPPQEQKRFLSVGPITLDRDKRLAIIGANRRTVELTENESAILACLMERSDRVVSSHDLARTALGYKLDEVEAQNLVRPHIFRLRRKIEDDPTRPHLIRTVRGRGYLLAF